MVSKRQLPRVLRTVTATEREERVDEATGEVRRVLQWEEPREEEIPRRGRPRKGSTRTRVQKGRAGKVTKKFAYVDVESMCMLELTVQERRVLMFMMSKIDQGTNEIRVTGAYIARSTGMTQNNVSRTIKSLRERLVILNEGYGVWRINSWIAWTGEYNKWYAATGGDEEPYWTREEYEESLKEGPALAVVE